MHIPQMMSPEEAEKVKRYLLRHTYMRAYEDDGRRHYEITDRGYGVMTALMYLVDPDELLAMITAQAMFRSAYRDLTEPPLDVNPN